MVSTDIRDILVSELGYVFATNLHIGKQPAQPDNCVTIYDTGGKNITDLSTGTIVDRGFQIRVRNLSYITAFTNANDIIDTLHARTNFAINTNFYIGIEHVNGPILLPYDDKNRIQLTINFKSQRRT